MKRMKILVALIVMTFAVACGQKADDTFKKPMYFEQGLTTIKVTFPDGSTLESAIGLGTTVTWSTLAGKPSTYPPDVHSHSYNDLTDKPQSIELVDAILSMQGVKLPVLTTDQINALTPTVGLLVYDSSLNVLKIYTGVWKILITAN